MLQFIRSVRTGDWNLHLLSTRSFVKYYFTRSKLNYAHMIPVYLADMESLKQSDANIYRKFLDNNWVVNKNPWVPFCAIGADHALKHLNRFMKVADGLFDITLNECARKKFFLACIPIARISTLSMGVTTQAVLLAKENRVSGKRSNVRMRRVLLRWKALARHFYFRMRIAFFQIVKIKSESDTPTQKICKKWYHT